MSNRFVAGVRAAWHRKWWILVPTVVTAIVTCVMSYYLVPTRYRSEATIRVVAARVPAEYVRTVTGRAQERFQNIEQSVLSRTRLEKMIKDFGMYQVERESAPLADLVVQMRKEINVDFVASDRTEDNDLGGITVSYESPDPIVAMKVTEAITRLVIDENMRERQARTDGTTQFIEWQIADARVRLIAHEKALETLRAQNGRTPLSQADLLPYDVLKEHFKALLIRREELSMAAQLERGLIGEQFRVSEPPRLPDRPVGPTRLGVSVAGTFVGLGLGIVAIAVRGRSGSFRLHT